VSFNVDDQDGLDVADGNTLKLREASANGVNGISISAPASVGSDYAIQLPASAGTSGQAMTVASVDGSTLALEFSTVSGGGGGGSSTFHIGVAGRAKVSSSNTSRLYVHTFGMAVDGDWSNYRTDGGATDTSFTASTADSIAYYRVASVPVACSMTKIALSCYHPATTNAHQLAIWRGALNSDGDDGSISWSLVGSRVSPFASGTGDGDAIWKSVQSVSSGGDFAAGDWIGLTWNTGGSYSSSYVYFDVSLLLEED